MVWSLPYSTQSSNIVITTVIIATNHDRIIKLKVPYWAYCKARHIFCSFKPSKFSIGETEFDFLRIERIGIYRAWICLSMLDRNPLLSGPLPLFLLRALHLVECSILFDRSCTNTKRQSNKGINKELIIE